MNRILRSGNATTNNHRATVTLAPSLRGIPSEYAFLVTAAGAVLDQRGAHVIGYELDAENNLKGFEVYSDEVIGDFSWIVVQLVSEEECDIQVKWFGAKGDGTTDDTTAIQNAINYGANRGNFNVVFGPGVFLYSDTLSLPPGNHGITLIGSRDAAAQQGSVRPATTLRWTGGAIPTVKIGSTFTTFRDVAVENAGGATYFAEVEPAGAGRIKFYGVSCYSGASIGNTYSKPFRKGFLKSPVTDYNRIERCEFAGAAPVIVDMDGAYGFCGSGTTTFIFEDSVLDSYFDTDVFRITNCSFEILTIVNNTFNAQANSSGKGDSFYKDLGFIYAGSGLTVVNSMNIDKDPAVAGGCVLGNLIFRDNEYDDTAYDDGSNPASTDAERKRLAGVRMLKLRRTLNLDLENNNIEGNGSNTAIVDLMDSVAHVGKNFAHSTGVLIRTLDAARQDLTFEATADSNGNADTGSYAGIVNPKDLKISGPNGDASIRATQDADDMASHIERAKSAISTAKAINDSTPATGVTATAWKAVYRFGGGFSDNVNIDGVMQSLAINGQPVVVNLDGKDDKDAVARRKQDLVDAINTQVIGVSARILCDRAVLIAADGRNISLSGTGTTAHVNSVGKEVLNFTTAVLAESVVARGGVTLHADHGFSSFSTARGVYGWGTADGARVFFKPNNVNFGNVSGLINKDTSAGIVKMTANPDQQVVVFGQLGDPGGMTTFQFDIPDNQTYTISIAESQNSPPYYGSMTRGQKVLVVARNVGGGGVKFSDQFKKSGLFASPGAGKSRAILFEYAGTVDYPKDPQKPDNPIGTVTWSSAGAARPTWTTEGGIRRRLRDHPRSRGPLKASRGHGLSMRSSFNSSDVLGSALRITRWPASMIADRGSDNVANNAPRLEESSYE